MKISEFAQACGVGIETVRYYQRRGLLLVPPRYPGSRRHYPVAWVRDVLQIRRLQALGFSLDEINPLLRQPVPDCSDVRQAVERSIQSTLDELERLSRRLQRLESALPGCPEGVRRRSTCGLSCLLGADVTPGEDVHRACRACAMGRK